MYRFHFYTKKSLLINIIVLLLVGYTKVHAQSYKLSNQYDLKKDNSIVFQFSTSESWTSKNRNLIKNYVQKSTVLDIDKSLIKNIRKNKSNLIDWSIEINGKKTTLLLFPYQNTSADYFNTNSEGERNNISSKVIHFRGYVKGAPNSMVSLNVFEDELRAIYSAKGQNTIINKVNEEYILYQEKDLKNKPKGICATHTEDLNTNFELNDSPNHQSKNISSNCIEVYIEADHQCYLDNYSDLNSTHDWMVSLFNDVATIYANDGMTVSLSSSKIWETQDPYTSKSSPGNMLSSFADQVKNNFQGRLAHLITTRPIDGGVAWVDVLCSSYSASSSSGPYAFSGNLSSNHTPFPTYSWNVNVFAHEMGHNIGSPHTHDCAWNGNNTQIDDCGNVAGFGGGACFDENHPIIPDDNEGSIMSYCYLNSGNGVSLADGFGSQPVALLHYKIEHANCATGCMESTCSDGIQNGDEDGIDCGGSICPDCPPAFNDNCSLALDINKDLNLNIGHQTLVFENANNTATGSGKSPSVPNYSGCNTFKSWCNYSIQKDVWYSFTAPLNMAPPHGAPLAFIKISTLGSDFDTQIALYKDCNSSAISANDDFHGASGSYQSLITAAVIPGQTYYLQVDGYNNSSVGDLQLNIDYFPLYGTCDSNSNVNDAEWEATDENGWTHYIDEDEQSIVLSINKNGQNIGWVGIDDHTSCKVMAAMDNSNLGTEGCSAPYASVPHWWVSHRTWHIDPMMQPNSPVEIRSYYTTEEFNSLISNHPFGLDHLQLDHFKVIGQEDVTLDGNECHQDINSEEFITFKGTHGEFTYGNYGTDHYAQYLVDDLLGGGGFGFINTQVQTLPIDLISFSAREDGLGNKINWKTANEINSQYQIIEKSYDGLGFWQEVGRKESVNELSTINEYSLIDKKPWGKTYYRLRSIDFDHAEQLSEIIYVERKDASFVSNIYPNPTFESFNLEINSTIEEELNWKIYSLKGQLMKEDTVKNKFGRNIFNIDISAFPSGIYQILIKRGNTSEVMRITKA